MGLTAAFKRDTRLILLAGGTVAAAFALDYMGTVYLTTYGATVLDIPRPTMLALGVVGGIVLVAATGTGVSHSGGPDAIGRSSAAPSTGLDRRADAGDGQGPLHAPVRPGRTRESRR